MKKTSANIRRLKYLRSIIYLFIAQLLIILLFCCISSCHRLATDENTTQLTITVEKVDYYYPFLSRNRMLKIYTDSMRYEFSNKGVGNYPTKKLYEEIAVGDELTIIVMENRNFWGGSSNMIVDARDEHLHYRSIQDYNSLQRKQIKMGRITLGIIESIFLLIACSYIFLGGKKAKSWIC